MRVLVTGGAGYVGSVVTRALLAGGHAVRVLDSLRYGGQALLGCYHDERFSFLRGDIRDAAAVEHALNGIEAVVHLAAIVGDPACARQPALAREVNRDASLQLAALSQRAGVQRFIFASTCSNYGRMADPASYATEETELQPVSLYAQTKVDVERALLTGMPSDAPVTTVLRFATVFGLSPRMRFDLTVNEFTLELLTKRKVMIYGEGFWRPYVHVRDAAEAVRLALESPVEKIRHKAFNVGGTRQNYRKGQLVELIRAHVGHPVQIKRVHTSEDPRDYRVSFERIAQELNFRITRTVEAGIRELIDAIRQGVVPDGDPLSYRN